MNNTIEITIDQAIESKAAFIQYFHYIQMAAKRPDVLALLENDFTDEMANNFLDYFNGSEDDAVVTLKSGEVLPNLIDAIEECIAAHSNNLVENALFTIISEPFRNPLEIMI